MEHKSKVLVVSANDEIFMIYARHYSSDEKFTTEIYCTKDGKFIGKFDDNLWRPHERCEQFTENRLKNLQKTKNILIKTAFELWDNLKEIEWSLESDEMKF